METEYCSSASIIQSTATITAAYTTVVVTLYEATRKYWPVAKDKRDKITHVVSHAHGIVQMVLRDLSYTICREDNGCFGRLIFSGTEDDNSPYIGKSMKHLVKHIQVTNYYNL